MDKTKKLTTKKVILILSAVFLACGCALGGLALAREQVKKVATDEEFTYVNPDETKAETDEGFKIDGVLDEEQYQNNNWLYLHNTDDKADVDVSMTSYFGEKGMYIVYDVTDRNPIYVNLDRASTVNSCIEMYLAPNDVTSRQNSHFFEIDLLPTGDMVFKKTDGKGAFIDVTTSNDIMAYLGATTKGGDVNTKECTGYCLELFIPWEYTEQFGMNSEAMKDSYIYVTPAHITSFNYEGMNSQEDRYWYFFGEQHGASMDLVYQYFRFDEKGVIGTTSTSLVEGDHYSITGDPAVIPGMKTTYTITPEEGYTINSVLVNGEEQIQNVSYSEEGAALLTVRGKTKGLEIKATAEAVTDGNKTLSGNVKIDAGSLNGVSVSYKGTNGKKPIEIDRNGNFVLTDLQQGYYKITVEKEGYDKLERGIYLNRDITTELELAAFFVDSGKSWAVDCQEDGILHRFGGKGVVLTRQSYDKFSIAINMKFDEKLAKEYEHTYFTQQRQGIQIKFSNDKYWNVDILYEQGGYKVQYAKIMGDKSIYDTWKGVYILSDKESALYTGEEGLTLEVRRDGKFGNVYLNDKLIAVEEFADEFEKCTAQVGFEAWVGNRVVAECPYKIQTDVNITKHTLFNASAGWDISGQFDGYISLPKGGSSRINFANKYVNMDLTLKVRDYQNDTDAEGKKARTDVLFVFDNGAHQSFGITTFKEGTVAIQSVGENDGKQIYDGFKDWGGHLTEEEKALYYGDGIDFRIVRNGTKIYLYVGDRQLKNFADLTNKKSGVTADMPATVYIRHYDDKGVEVIIPFKLKTELDTVTIDSVESANGKVVGARNDYLVGDEVTLTGKGKDGYYCTSMKVNGEEVSMNFDGTYTFKATEKKYTVEGEFAKQVFTYNKRWNLLKQNEGIVSLPNGGDGGMLQFYKPYTNIDLKLTARDYADKGDTKARTDVLFVFENGRHLSFGLTTYSSGTVAIQSLNKAGADDGKQIYKKFTDWGGHLTNEEKALYRGNGIDFRIVRNGTKIYLYVGDRQLKKVADLTSNNSGVTANMPATVYLRHYDDAGVEVTIPFEVKTKLDTVTIESVESANGKVIGARNDYLIGDEVTLSGKGKDGYYCTSMKVNGKEVSMNYDGTYTFKATEKKYTVEGEFAKQVFVYNNKWNLLKQNEGIVSLPNGGDGGMLQFYKPYTNIDLKLTARDYADKGDTKARTDVLFIFENGRHLSFGLTTYSSGIVAIQSLNKAGADDGQQIYKKFTDWGGHLTDEEKALYRGDGIDFRIVRNGTKIYLYVGDRQLKKVADLTSNNSGVTANMPATVYLRHYDDAGVEVTIPFELKTELDTVAIESIEGVNGKVIAARNDYLVGDEITLSGEGKEGYYCTSMKVNGKEVPMNYDGTYTFKATEKKYTVEGEFAKQVFVYNNKWNLLKQNEGVVSLPNGGEGGRLQFYEEYTDIDLTLKAKDDTSVNSTGRTDVLFNFENGAHISFGFRKREDNTGLIAIQSQNNDGADNDGTIYKKWHEWGTLNKTEKAQYQGEGIDFRIARKGTLVYLYLGDRQLAVVNLENNNSGVTADMKATIYIRHYNDAGVEITIPFELKTEIETVAIESNEGENGKVVAAGNAYLVGDKVTLSGEGKEGYYCTSMKVNGEEVPMNYDGTYTFTATEKTYIVEGEFAKQVFVYNSEWNLLEQNKGVVSLPNGGYGMLQLYKEYTNIDLTLTARDYTSVTSTGRTDVLFNFENGAHISFGFRKREDNTGLIAIQSQNNDGADNDGTIYKKWTEWGTLNKAEEKLYQGEGIDFRIVRKGILVYLYLGDSELAVVNLTNNSSGVTAEMPATIYIRHYNDAGVEVELPFKIKEVLPQGTFSTTELAAISSWINVSTEQTTAGAKITYDNSTSKWARVGVQKMYNLDENGVHIEVTDIEYASGDYAFSMYFGNKPSVFFDQRGYALIYESNGKFSIVATKEKGTPQASPKVRDRVQLDPLTGKLSIDIKLVGKNYVIDVNDNSFTIPAEYQNPDTGYNIAETNWAKFSFAFVDTSHNAALFPGATYTIQSIKYNVGGVTIEPSSKTMMVGQTTKLTATVNPTDVSNKAVTWTSSDESIATVDKNGKVVAVSEGTATITATSVKDITKTADCQVTVNNIMNTDALTHGNGKIEMLDTATGVQVTASTETQGWSRVHTSRAYSMGTGVNIEISDIQAKDENYSIVVAIGADSKQWYDKSGYMLVCGQKGEVAIVETDATTKKPITDKVIASVKFEQPADSLSISAVKKEKDYIITVNGKELTIANGAEVLGNTCYLAFGVMSDITIVDGKVTGLNYSSTGADIGRKDNVSFVIESIQAASK